MKSVDARAVRWGTILLSGLALAVVLAPAAQAQPFGAWLTLQGNPTKGFVEIGNHPALNPTSAFTLEAWVAISNSASSEDCRSIAGKNWQASWWIGQCTVGGQPTLRSYLKGGIPSQRNGGIIPRGVWTHVAVVFNGTQRLHYINGELAATFAESGPLPASTSPMRIGSDVSWNEVPAGAIDEVRLWNVARTQAQIRTWINKRVTTTQPGLVAVWADSPADIIGPHDGMLMGSGVGYLTFPPGGSCTTTATQLCLQGRFIVTARWRTSPVPGTTDGDAKVAVNSPNSGIFWFFTSDNWEVMVKAINACVPPFNRYWIYSAATTDQFFRMEVFDVVGKENKVYFNYAGPPAPAITDSDAFATCP